MLLEPYFIAVTVNHFSSSLRTYFLIAFANLIKRTSEENSIKQSFRTITIEGEKISCLNDKFQRV
jgi:hypothetical protein